MGPLHDRLRHLCHLPVAWMRSLRWRLLGATLVALSVALAGAGWVLSNLFADHVTAQFDAQLLRQLDQLTAAFEPDAQQRPQLGFALSDPRWQAPYSGLYWQIERPGAPGTDRVLLRSRSLWDTELSVPDDNPHPQELHRHLRTGPNGQAVVVLERRVQFVGGPANPADPVPPGWRLLVAADTAELSEAVADFDQQLALFLGVLGLALVAAAVAQVTLGLAPLRELQAAVQAIRTGRQPRLVGAFPAEVDPLVQDFNAVLDQNEQVVARARQMAGNLAHAIKTPLAVIGTVASEHSAGWPVATTLQEQVDSIRQQVDWHLGRARASSAGVVGLRTRVEPALQGLVRVMRKVHAQRPSRSDSEVPAPDLAVVLAPVPPDLQFAGESQDLQEMVGNLLDNACKWARSEVWVIVRKVAGHGNAGQLSITVQDDGPGLDPAACEQVFARGFRADERTPGTGLGLHIAREIAHLYGGDIALGPGPMGGLQAVLTLPAAGAAGAAGVSTAA